MKRIGIITICDYNNYGNRLQNFAVQEIINKFPNYYAETIKNKEILNNKTGLTEFFLRFSKYIFDLIISRIKKNIFKNNNFKKFNGKIIYSKNLFNWFYVKRMNKYDFFIVGSDQVWNPNLGRLKDLDLLIFAEERKKIAFSASFGINELKDEKKEKICKKINDFKYISVREDIGREIIQELTGRKDVEVLVDPTMLLTSDEWDKISKKPNELKANKYIFNYFLGDLSKERKEEIERIAKDNNCEIINLLDKNDPLYVSGPSEFLYLEKHAFLICTDSFHSSVFAILYNRPFIVFDREQKGVENMNSRIDTLINKFKLENRRFTGRITKENLEHDYTEAYKILEEERKKSDEFLRKALDIKE